MDKFFYPYAWQLGCNLSIGFAIWFVIVSVLEIVRYSRLVSKGLINAEDNPYSFISETLPDQEEDDD